MVDVSAWRDHCANGHDYEDPAFITELEWFSHIQALVDGDGQVPLESFIVSPALYLSDDFIAAWAQFVWQVATRLEVQIFASRGSEVGQDDWVRTEEPEMSTDWSIRAVDRTCMLHRASCKGATRGAKFIGIALDKVGGCRSLDLQNAFAVLPSNVAFPRSGNIC